MDELEDGADDDGAADELLEDEGAEPLLTTDELLDRLGSRLLEPDDELLLDWLADEDVKVWREELLETEAEELSKGLLDELELVAVLDGAGAEELFETDAEELLREGEDERLEEPGIIEELGEGFSDAVLVEERDTVEDVFDDRDLEELWEETVVTEPRGRPGDVA